MKEQLLHLDPHDDFQSARDKMGWTQTARVLLIWPAKGRVLARRLDLLLLQRHAQRLGATLAVIATDPEVRDHAGELGLPAFDTVARSRRANWRAGWRLRQKTRQRPTRAQMRQRPDPQALRPQSPRSIPFFNWAGRLFNGLFFLLGLAALLALAYALAPSATITLRPAAQAVSVDVSVIADPSAEAVLGNVIPARSVRVEVEAADLTATTGQKRVPTTAATGSVVFTNLTGQVIIIPANTGLRTTSGTPARFQTTSKTVVEARLGATSVVPIQAIDLGPVGNVAAGQINAIDGPLGLSLAVTNPDAASGGAESFKAAVIAADRDRLRQQLLTRLTADALTAVQSQLQPGEFLAADSLTTTETLLETYDYGIGEAADTAHLTLRLAFRALAMTESDARLVAQNALAAQVPEGYALLPGREQFIRADDLATRAGQPAFTVQATSIIVPLVDHTALRESAKGQPIGPTQLRLAKTLPLADLPEITVWPAWVGRLPIVPFKISVVVVAP
jgi:hypothetical protein